MILPETTDEGALAVAEKVLGSVTSLQIPHENSEASEYVTLSIGVATIIPAENSQPQTLIEKADQMLYRAKERGRNCIEVALPSKPLQSVGG